MRFFLTLQSLLLCLVSLSFAAELTISIPSSPALPNPASLPPSTHATLVGPDGVLRSARLSRTNTLTFRELPLGSHLLNVHTRDYVFAPSRVDITITAPEAGDDSKQGQELIEVHQTFRGNEWSNKGGNLGSSGTGSLSINLQPSGKKDFYQQRAGFDVMSLFKNPMVLMGLVMMGFVFGMPYLMDNMDEETKAEFEEMQKKSPLTGGAGAASSLQNFDLASFLAGKSGASESSQATKAKR